MNEAPDRYGKAFADGVGRILSIDRHACAAGVGKGGDGRAQGFEGFHQALGGGREVPGRKRLLPTHFDFYAPEGHVLIPRRQADFCHPAVPPLRAIM